MRWGTRRRESGDSPGGGYQAGRPVPLPSMTTGAGQVLPSRPTTERRGSPPARGSERAWRGRSPTCCWWPTRCSPSCGRGPCRPRSGRSPAPPRAPARSLLIPVVLVLGGGSLVSLGVASMAFSAVAFLMLITGLLAPAAGASLLAGCGIGFATWLFLVCRGGNVPPRAGRVGRRAGVAALVGTALLAAGTSRCRPRRRPGSRCSCSAASPRCWAGWPCPRGACAWRAGCARTGRAAPGGTTRTGTASPGGTTSPLRRLVAWAPSSPSTRTPTTRPSPREARSRGPRRPGTGSCSSSPPAASWANRCRASSSRGSSWPCAAPPSATPRRRRSGPSAWSSSASPTPG